MTRRGLRLALVPVLLLPLACGGDGGGSTGPAAVASVTVSPSSATILEGETTQLSATVRDADGTVLTDRTVTWSSSATGVATVDNTGLVQGVSDGSATVSATSEGRSGQAAITVNRIPVATVEVDAGDGELLVGETLQLTVTVKDDDGNILSGRSVSFEGSDDDVATVSAQGLVTGVSAGEVTVTATSEGQDGTADVTVSFPSFAPTADTDISGTATYETFDIPLGVTVTVTGELEILATTELTVDGTLSGDCFGITLRSSVAASIGGMVSNVCATDPDTETPGDILIVAGTDVELDGANLVTSGEGVVTNDETLTDDDFDAAAASGPRRASAQLGQCYSVGSTFDTDPPQARTGSDGVGQGNSGRNARGWTLNCSGDYTLSGDTEINGQEGGDGGDAENADSDTSNGSSSGGNGGNGGTLKVQSTGSIWFNNSNGGGTTLRLAKGGDAGSASITATSPGGSATATGGDGGDSGTFRVAAQGGITIDEGGLTIVVGDGGSGGDATATAADGLDAGENPAQDGGSATATGGKGGSTPKGTLRATGNVSGLGNVQVTGGNGGSGGDAIGIAGNGGSGNETHIHGADGGALAIAGGDGGNSLVEVSPSGGMPSAGAVGPLLTPVGDGGDGGLASFSGAMGGHGWDGCSVTPHKVGGNGGEGGQADGVDGNGGTGNVPGVDGGGLIATATGDAGHGGDGDGPGDGGDAHEGIIIVTGVLLDLDPNFVDGEDGDPCAVPTKQVVPKLSMIPSTGGVVAPGAYPVDLEENGEKVGSMDISTVGDEGNHFFGSDPTRLGLGGNGQWSFDVGTVDVTGSPDAAVGEVEFCFLNTFGVTDGNPIVVEVQDGEGNVLSTTNVVASPPAPGDGSGMAALTSCHKVTSKAGAKRIRVKNPLGAVIDLYILVIFVWLLGFPVG